MNYYISAETRPTRLYTDLHSLIWAMWSPKFAIAGNSVVANDMLYNSFAHLPHINNNLYSAIPLARPFCLCRSFVL